MCLRLVTLDLQDHMEVQPKFTLTKWWQGGKETMQLVHNLHLFCAISTKVFSRTVDRLWSLNGEVTDTSQLATTAYTFYLIYNTFWLYIYTFCRIGTLKLENNYYLLLFAAVVWIFLYIVRTFFELYSVKKKTELKWATFYVNFVHKLGYILVHCV